MAENTVAKKKVVDKPQPEVKEVVEQAFDYQSSNEDILNALEENGIELSTKPVIIDIHDSKNPEWATVFMMAKVKLAADQSSLTRAQLLTKKFSNVAFILRAVEAIPFETLEENGWEVGSEMNFTDEAGNEVEFAFQIQDSTEPWFDNQNPRINSKDELMLDANGNKIYRQARLITLEELEGFVDEETGETVGGVGHDTIPAKPASKFNVPEMTS